MTFSMASPGVSQISLLNKKRITALVFSITILFSSFAVANDDVRQIQSEDSRALIKRAEKLVRRGEFVEAEKILQSVLRTTPDNTKATLSLARLMLRQRRTTEAYDLAFEVAKVYPKNAYAFAILGESLLGMGEFDDAKLAYVNALYLNKREALAWAGLGMIDFYENRISDSIDNLREAVYHDSQEPDFVFALGQVSARGERYKEAAEAYQRFLRISMKSSDERRERIAGLIRFLNYLGNKPSLYNIGGEKRTSVPMQLIGNRPIIKLHVNDRDEPLSFVLDTGSGISVISHSTAKRLKIKPITKGGKARALGGDGKFEIVYGFLRNVNIGGVKIRNIPVYIREFHAGGPVVDGYIGISLISKFLTTVDYGEQTFTLVRKESSEKQSVENEALSLPLRLTSSGFLSGKVYLEGVESSLNFILDTGASISVISDDLANSKEISPFLHHETMRVIGAAGITENVPSFMLPRVSFGKNSRSSVKAIALDLDIINEASGFEQAGILGGNFLKDYRLTFDFENSKVLFIPIHK